MDYSAILDDKTKRRILMDRYENQKNIIQYFIDEHEPKEVISDMEDLVMMMDNFLETHFKDTIVREADKSDPEGESITIEA